MKTSHMDEVDERPLLSATGQKTLLKTCGAVFATGLAMVVVAPVLLYRDQQIVAIGLFIVGTIAMLSGAFVALRWIRCPRCKIPWLQHALGEKDIGGWLSWLLGFTRCPECGLSSETRSDDQSKM
jgi:hypothetical protein